MPRRNRTLGWPDLSAQQRRRNVMPAPPRGSESRDVAIRVVPEADDVLAVCLEGEFDLLNVSTVDEEIDRALQSKKDLILDLSEATFIDASVIDVLFRASSTANASGQKAVLQLGTAPIVERVLEIVRIDQVLQRAHSRSEAIQIIQRGAATE
jgi:anti-anti-sigma factor